mmetsp:Transcript_33634/g.84779  ORF Transcript_33634/g.84779 Transcript_33634/m.84779 type:complete len:218 (+) Transcript_33634:745-1398(+)
MASTCMSSAASEWPTTNTCGGSAVPTLDAARLAAREDGRLRTPMPPGVTGTAHVGVFSNVRVAPERWRPIDAAAISGPSAADRAATSSHWAASASACAVASSRCSATVSSIAASGLRPFCCCSLTSLSPSSPRRRAKMVAARPTSASSPSHCLAGSCSPERRAGSRASGVRSHSALLMRRSNSVPRCDGVIQGGSPSDDAPACRRCVLLEADSHRIS